MADYNSCTSGAITLSTIDARCDKSIGGISEILIANRDDVESVALNANAEITGITLATGKHFYSWKFRRNTGNYTSTVESDLAIGNSFVTTEVSLQFTKAEAQKRLDIQSAINAGCVVIVKDMFGQYIYLGMDNDVQMKSVVMQSGTSQTDLNGFTLTFEDVSLELPHFLVSSFDISSLLS